MSLKKEGIGFSSFKNISQSITTIKIERWHHLEFFIQSIEHTRKIRNTKNPSLKFIWNSDQRILRYGYSYPQTLTWECNNSWSHQNLLISVHAVSRRGLSESSFGDGSRQERKEGPALGCLSTRSYRLGFWDLAWSQKEANILNISNYFYWKGSPGC